MKGVKGDDMMIVAVSILFILSLSVLVYLLLFAKYVVVCTDYNKTVEIPYPIWKNYTNVCYERNMTPLPFVYVHFFTNSIKWEVR